MSNFDLFLTSIALVLIFEGFFPLVNPGLWRKTMTRLSEQSDASVRIMGIGCFALAILIFIVI